MIDMSKKYRTRDGREVRIYDVDAGGAHPVHGAILSKADKGDWRPASWNNNQRFLDNSTIRPGDLVEAKAEVWVWVYASGKMSSHAHDTKEHCEKWRGTPELGGKAVRFVQEDEA
jgi:hypothetical protein